MSIIISPTFKGIPKLIGSGNYKVDIPWDHLQGHIERQNINMDPEFQRGHVWTVQQQIEFVEYKLRVGMAGSDVYINCPNFLKGDYTDMVLVDGKQRITAVLKFLDNKIPAFNYLFKEYTDKMRMTGPCFQWHVNSLKDYRDVLLWYIQMNSGGTPHSKEEIDRVRKLMKKYKYE